MSKLYKSFLLNKSDFVYTEHSLRNDWGHDPYGLYDLFWSAAAAK